MRSSVPPTCSHCQSSKSPLWRRGANQEMLCNACGLYWKHHGSYRPISLKQAADRKSETSSVSFTDSDSFDSSASATACGTNGSRLMISQHSHHSQEQQKAKKKTKSCPLRTGNILMAPGQYGMVSVPQSQRLSSDQILPPLNYKPRDLSFPNPLAGQRGVTAAPILPNLRSVLDQMRSEELVINQVQQPVQQQPLAQGKAVASMVTAGIASKSSSTSIANTTNYIGSKAPIPLKFIINQGGVTMYQGDHASIRGDDGQIYYAVLMDFWLTENGRRYCTLRWLVPKPAASNGFALISDRFDLGPLHGRVEPMESILEVFYSPYRDHIPTDVIRQTFLHMPHSGSKSASNQAHSNGNELHHLCQQNNQQSHGLSGSLPSHVRQATFKGLKPGGIDYSNINNNNNDNSSINSCSGSNSNSSFETINSDYSFVPYNHNPQAHLTPAISILIDNSHQSVPDVPNENDEIAARMLLSMI